MSTLKKACRDVARIEGALAEAETRLATLERERGQVALKGGDLDAHHIALFSATETIKTLRSGLDLAREAAGAEAAKEKRKELEARADDLRSTQLPLIAVARSEATLALRDVAAMLEDMAAAKAAIEAFNDEVRQSDGDLAIRIEPGPLETPHLRFRPPTLSREPKEDDASFAARQRAAEAAWAADLAHAERPYQPLEDERAFHARQRAATRQVRPRNNESANSLAQRRAVEKAKVVRNGETDEEYRRRRLGAQVGVFQGEGETAGSFDLRVANAQSRRHRQAGRGRNARSGETQSSLLAKTQLRRTDATSPPTRRTYAPWSTVREVFSPADALARA